MNGGKAKPKLPFAIAMKDDRRSPLLVFRENWKDPRLKSGYAPARLSQESPTNSRRSIPYAGDHSEALTLTGILPESKLHMK
jgi:hypothetical protein